MKNLFHAGKFLILDMASTIFFLAIYAATHSIVFSVVVGMTLGLSQIIWQAARGAKVDAMQWASLLLVVSTGAATLFTHDPRFVMFKPTVIYCVIGASMLQRGWMNRYMPPIAQAHAADLTVVWGYAWAAMMFASAILNLVLLMTLPLAAWAAAMSLWSLISKPALFAIHFTSMRLMVIHRIRRIGAGALVTA